jgi:transposase
MIPTGVQVFLALEPIDLRWSFDRLSGAAVETIGYDARSGALFVFYGRRKDALKILFFDGTGMVIASVRRIAFLTAGGRSRRSPLRRPRWIERRARCGRSVTVRPTPS